MHRFILQCCQEYINPDALKCGLQVRTGQRASPRQMEGPPSFKLNTLLTNNVQKYAQYYEQVAV